MTKEREREREYYKTFMTKKNWADRHPRPPLVDCADTQKRLREAMQ
jgi:hypothetical protein